MQKRQVLSARPISKKSVGNKRVHLGSTGEDRREKGRSGVLCILRLLAFSRCAPGGTKSHSVSSQRAAVDAEEKTRQAGVKKTRFALLEAWPVIRIVPVDGGLISISSLRQIANVDLAEPPCSC